MPERGLQRDSERAGELDESAYKIVLEDASLLQVTFEVDARAALELMPPSLTRPVPAYGRLVMLDAKRLSHYAEDMPFPLEKHEPFFGCVTLLLGVRLRQQPGNLMVAAGDDACRCCWSLPHLLGFRSSKGQPRVHISAGRAIARPRIGRELQALVQAPNLRAVDPSLLRWDPWLTAVSTGRATTGLAEWPIDVQCVEAFVSDEATMRPEFDREGPLASRGMISACLVRGAVTFGPPVLHEA